MLRTIGDQPGLWESILPAELLMLPGELARVDELLDAPAFFAPLVPCSSTRGWVGRRRRWRSTYG